MESWPKTEKERTVREKGGSVGVGDYNFKLNYRNKTKNKTKPPPKLNCRMEKLIGPYKK